MSAPRKEKRLIGGVEHKQCGRCDEWKPCDAEHFHRNRSTPDGWQWTCKQCMAVATRKYKAENRERYLATHRERQKERHRTLRPDLVRKFGITKADYDGMVAARAGMCDICGIVPARLVVDHDHGSGRLRGLLCGPCNSAIGLLRDDPLVIMAAAQYVEKRR